MTSSGAHAPDTGRPGGGGHHRSSRWNSPRTQKAREMLRKVLRGRGLRSIPTRDPVGMDLRAVERVFGDSR